MKRVIVVVVFFLLLIAGWKALFRAKIWSPVLVPSPLTVGEYLVASAKDGTMWQATVVTMYLLPDTVNLLKDKLLTELKPGTRIVSHDYPLTGWMADNLWQMDLEEKVKISGVTTTLIYLYVVPAKVAGKWQAHMPPAISRQPAALTLKQQISRVSGSLRLDGRDVPIEDGKLRGEHLSFRLVGHKGEFSGVVKGGAIEGMIDGKMPWTATLGG